MPSWHVERGQLTVGTVEHKVAIFRLGGFGRGIADCVGVIGRELTPRTVHQITTPVVLERRCTTVSLVR